MNLFKRLIAVSVIAVAVVVGFAYKAEGQERRFCDVGEVQAHLMNSLRTSLSQEQIEREIALAEMAVMDLFDQRCYEDAESYWHSIARSRLANDYVRRNAEIGLMRVLAVRQREAATIGRRP